MTASTDTDTGYTLKLAELPLYNSLHASCLKLWICESSSVDLQITTHSRFASQFTFTCQPREGTSFTINLSLAKQQATKWHWLN